MENILFICRFSITFSALDTENPDRKEYLRAVYNHLVDCARLWLAQIYEDYKIDQPEYPDGLTNQYQRTDLIYIYRMLNYPSSIPHIAKLCEGYAGVLALLSGAEIQVDYLTELPPNCQPPCNPNDDGEYVRPAYRKK